MELGLSLGDGVGFLREDNNSEKPTKKKIKTTALDFCMGLGLNSSAAGGGDDQEREKPQKSNDQDDDDDDDDDDDQMSEGDHQGSDDDNTPVQLNLLPLAPVPRRTLPNWSTSDNGSPENGSSGNMGLPAAARGLDVNRFPPAAAEEVSSANSVGTTSSPFHMEFGMFRSSTGNLQVGGQKREFEAATGHDVVESERGSDDDENGLQTRKKLRLSKEQSAFLEESFKEHSTLNPKQKLALAKQLNLRPRQVEVWFQNRRARTKLKQTEVDCEYLKRCCETLSEENRRLHKELQELRALKTSNPFYMQLPATTLTMCPSCERVATAPPPTAAAAVDSIPKPITSFPLTRPRFYPFSQTPTGHPNQPAAS
ncbi:UNVERIFIED_CONTAM: Homeobox-leucine zipper protein HAT14 [Sesamum latifolium]|uniref:Homeobox-leucine zipper protein HAT14 n=1 Tax=Sesamum latifolium TaxID=2727402 RepID=A0AAW2YF78_9LAMI